MTWKIFKAAFLDRFFPYKMKEEKVMEFINIRQGGKSVHEYSLKFIKLSKYSLSLVSDPRDQMRHFVTGVSEDLQEECQSAMLHDNMNIFRLMVYAKRVEEARAKRKSRDAKRDRSFDGGSSKNRLEIQDKAKFKKRGPNQIPTKFPRASCDRVSNPKFKNGKVSNSPKEKPTCGKCDKKHYGECFKGTIISLVVERVVAK